MNRTAHRSRIAGIALAALLIAGCEIEDDLVIQSDGSGTYQAHISAARIAGHVVDRLRAAAEQDGFRIVDVGETLTHRFIVIRKDFTDVRTLSNAQSNYELLIERPTFFTRRYVLRITLASVSGASFERRFRITMPGRVVSTTAGRDEGQQVIWFCDNGGTIEVIAEAGYLPFDGRAVAVTAVALLLAAAAAAALAWRRFGRRQAIAVVTEDADACTTCYKPLAPGARFCAACGDRVLPPPGSPQRPSGSP